MRAECWVPRPWSDQLAGCTWLPRMLDKARRALASQRQGRDLMGGYLFGDLDYADGQLLKFLGANETQVLELVAQEEGDTAVAEQLVRQSGHTPQEIEAWNKRFRRANAPFIAMWEADEGRRQPGIGTSLLRFFYNFVLMPPAYAAFRIGCALRRAKR